MILRSLRVLFATWSFVGVHMQIIAFNVSMVEYGDCAEANELKYGSPNVDTFS